MPQRNEQRIVTKTTRAARREINRPLTRAGKNLRFGQRSGDVQFHQRQHAAEPRRPLLARHGGQQAQQLRVVVRVAAVARRAGVERGSRRDRDLTR